MSAAAATRPAAIHPPELGQPDETADGPGIPLGAAGNPPRALLTEALSAAAATAGAAAIAAAVVAAPPRPCVPAGVTAARERDAPPRSWVPATGDVLSTTVAELPSTPPRPSVPAAGVVAADPLLDCAANAAGTAMANASSERSDRRAPDPNLVCDLEFMGLTLPPDAVAPFGRGVQLGDGSPRPPFA